MANYAKIVKAIVVEVVMADDNFLETVKDDSSCIWLKTSYNTSGGVHANGGEPLRKNFAVVGHTYDSYRDAFFGPQPHLGWLLDDDTYQWYPPIPKPEDGQQYVWCDETHNWKAGT